MPSRASIKGNVKAKIDALIWRDEDPFQRMVNEGGRTIQQAADKSSIAAHVLNNAIAYLKVLGVSAAEFRTSGMEAEELLRAAASGLDVRGGGGDTTAFKTIAYYAEHPEQVTTAYGPFAYDDSLFDSTPADPLYMERPDWYDHDPMYTPYYDPNLPAASRADRVANVFSEAAVLQLLVSAISTGKAFAMPISTKSGHPKFQRLCLVTTVRAANCRLGIPKQSLAMQEIVACPYGESYLKEDTKRSVPCVNFAHLWWRYSNRNSDGNMRMIPCHHEISHHPEAFNYIQAILEYQPKDGEELPVGVLALISSFKIYSERGKVFDNPKPGDYQAKKEGGWMFHRLNLESTFWNQLRIPCRQRGLANKKKSTGEYFVYGEDTNEPSMCPHEDYGCICYSPHPDMLTVEDTTSEESASEELSGEELSGEEAQEEAQIDLLRIGRTRVSDAHLLTPPSPPSEMPHPMPHPMITKVLTNNVPEEGIDDAAAIAAATDIVDMVATQGQQERQVSQGAQVERIVPIEFFESDSELDSDDEGNREIEALCYERYRQHGGPIDAARRAAARAVPVVDHDGSLFASFARLPAAAGSARPGNAPPGGGTVDTDVPTGMDVDTASE